MSTPDLGYLLREALAMIKILDRKHPHDAVDAFLDRATAALNAGEGTRSVGAGGTRRSADAGASPSPASLVERLRAEADWWDHGVPASLTPRMATLLREAATALEDR